MPYRQGGNAADAMMESLKIAPPAVVTGAHVIGGMSLADWVAICTLLYIAAQVGLLIPRYRKVYVEWRKARKERKGRDDDRS